MTEAEWLACEDSWPMLEFLRGKARDRKLRLFAAACCRLVHGEKLPNYSDEASLVERFADGTITEEERSSFQEINRSATDIHIGFEREARAWEMARRWASSAAVLRLIYLCHLEDAGAQERADSFGAAERRTQANLLREIMGNPIRPAALEPSWLTPNVVELAQTIYEDRAFERLPILADALLDAGCENSDAILAHCRSSGPHVRGCWVVDVILGKE